MALPFASEVESITNNKIMPQVGDNVYNKHPLLRWFRSNKRLFSGGPYIQVPIWTSLPTSSDVEYFSGSSTHDVTISEKTNAARFSPKQIVGKVHLSRREILLNGSPQGIVQLVASRSRYIEAGLRRVLTQGIFSDGTAGTGAGSNLQLTGILAALDTTATAYGSITSTDVSTWTPASNANGGTNRPLTLDLMTRLMLSASDGDDAVNLIVADEDVFREFHALLQPFERTAPGKGESGFKTADGYYRGVPFLVDKASTANEMYFLNSNHFFLMVHRDEDMTVVTEQYLEKQHTMLKKIYSMCELVCDERRRLGILDDITAG